MKYKSLSSINKATIELLIAVACGSLWINIEENAGVATLLVSYACGTAYLWMEDEKFLMLSRGICYLMTALAIISITINKFA